MNPFFFKHTTDSFSRIVSQSAQQAFSAKTFWDGVLAKDFASTILHHEELFDAAQEMSFHKYIRMFYKYIIRKSTRRMLTIVVYGKGKATKLNVDCNISSLDKIDQTKLTLDHHDCT